MSLLILIAAVTLSYAVADTIDTLIESITWNRCIRALDPAAKPIRRSYAFSNPSQLHWVPDATLDKLAADTIRARWRGAHLTALTAAIVATAMFSTPAAGMTVGTATTWAILALAVSMALAVLSAAPEVRRTLRAVERAYCAHHGTTTLPPLTANGRHVDAQRHPLWWVMRG